MAKSSRGFPLQIRLLIALAFERDTGAKLFRGFPLQCHLLIAQAFERGAVAKPSRGCPLVSKTVGRVDSQFIICILGIYNSRKQKVKGITIYKGIWFLLVHDWVLKSNAYQPRRKST